MCPHSVPSTVVASVSAPESLNFLYIRLLFRSLVPQTEAAGVEGLMSGEFSMSPMGVATYCIPAVSLGTAGSASPLALTYSMRPALASPRGDGVSRACPPARRRPPRTASLPQYTEDLGIDLVVSIERAKSVGGNMKLTEAPSFPARYSQS